jgi:hypothetical protein
MNHQRRKTAVSRPRSRDSSHFDGPDGKKWLPADVLRRIAGHARQVRDMARMAELLGTVAKPLTKSEHACIRRTVTTHARLMVEWVEKLPR